MSDKEPLSGVVLDITEATLEFRGPRFFVALTLCLTRHLGLRFAFVAEKRLSTSLGYTLAFADAENIRHGSLSYDLSNLPCRTVLAGQAVNVPCNVAELYPGATSIASYCGLPLKSQTGEVMGILAVEDTKDFIAPERIERVLKAINPRVAAELELDRYRRGVQKVLTD
ncbi:MAG: hypothetical protein KGM99_07655 [Burkholderiales bacterium]|nr:hypothetical protein [Burkholderiales bacterium]